MAKGRGYGNAGLRRNAVYMACVAELDACGISHTVERGPKHPKLCFEVQGVLRKMAFAGSPSDNARGFRNQLAQLRRILREAERPPDLRMPERAQVWRPRPPPPPPQNP